MNRYVVTPQARDDLDSIWDYIAGENIDAADRVIAELADAIRSLAEFPGMGRVRDDLGDEPLLVWPVRSYLIIYRAESAQLEVVRVVSGFRDLLALFVV